MSKISTRAHSDGVSYGEIIRLAWPASIAASITPLLGTIDVWALGQSDAPLAIAAVGLAAVIFSLSYWTFGFIRMSVAGLTAQAVGRGEMEEARLSFIRAVILGGTIGTIILLLQWPIGRAAFHLLSIGSDASEKTFQAARVYFSIRIWGAPFALATYACLGWLTARGRTDFLMLTGIIMTGVNGALDIWFVLGLQWGAAGIAAGTLIAEILGFFVSLGFVCLLLHRDRLLFIRVSRPDILNTEKICQTLSVNFDIFIRTLLLAFSFTWFVQRGSAFGDVTLAANQVLMQLFLFTGLALDGTAIAAETLVGRAIGQRPSEKASVFYFSVVRRSFLIASAGALFFSGFYMLFGESLIGLLAPAGAISIAATLYLPWVIISPLMVMICFQLDGIFVGATHAREMRNSMIASVALFAPLSLWVGHGFGNHGLWLAFLMFFLFRAGTLFFYLPRINALFR